jgi:HAD superfamily hydrolase (TIGR01509 family)
VTLDGRLVVFDLDGVVLDTVPALFDCYLGFLARFGRTGTRAEFERLNGPSLPEIIVHLRREHGLPSPAEELLAAYKNDLRAAYQRAHPMAGVDEVLVALADAGARLALATAADRSLVEAVLSLWGLGPRFACVVTGSEVKAAKPSPEIYLRVREHFGGMDGVAIEDSANGMRAASAAGMHVIAFGPTPVDDVTPLARVASMGELKTVLEARAPAC